MQRRLAWGLTHLSFLIMLVMLFVDFQNRKYVFHPSAWFSVGFLVLILSLNPLLLYFKGGTWLHYLNRYRQQIGVAAFSHAALHVACFASFKGSIGAFFNSVMTYPQFMVVGFLGTPVLLILAMTSSKCVIKSMGFARWKFLHKSVYVAEIAIIAHLVLMHKWSIVLLVFGPLVVLQLLRVRHIYRQG